MTLSAAELIQIDRICDRFDHDSRNGLSPAIETFLQTSTVIAPERLFSELLRIELEYRNERQDSLRLESYATRFPQFSDSIEAEFDKLNQKISGESTFTGGAGSVRLGTTETLDHSRDELELPGLLLDRYQLQGEIGKGSFGRVYKAHDQTLKREVAIKVSRWKLDHTSLIDEARKAGQLDHPGIVPVYDAQQMADGHWLIVSKLIDGQTLRERTQSAPLSHQKSIKIVARVAEALHHAHANGVTHRDLKPGNILLDKDDQPFITDFGLAIEDDSQHLQHGEVSGSPRYMSPEQVCGDSHFLDGRSDIWSLGVILYELLTGRPPFRGNTSAAVGDEIKNREPKPPRMIDDKIPVAVETACLKAMSKAVQHRHTTAMDFAHELRAGQPENIDRSPKAAMLPLSAPWQRKTVIIPAGLMLLSVLFVFWRPWQHQQESNEGELPRPVAAESKVDGPKPVEDDGPKPVEDGGPIDRQVADLVIGLGGAIDVAVDELGFEEITDADDLRWPDFSVTWVELNHTKVSDRALSTISRLQHLQGVGLHNCSVSDAGVEKLVPMENVYFLDLKDTLVTDQVGMKLATMKRLRTLKLSDTQITSKTIQALADSNTPLTDLFLKQTNIDDDDLEVLSRIHTLRFLDLRDNAITDAGLLHLISLPNLEQVDVTRSRQITKQMIDQFPPNCVNEE